MKILVISERLPSRIGGGVAREFNLIRELSKNHEISVVTGVYPWDQAQIPELQSFCNTLEIVPLPSPQLPRCSDWYWRWNAWSHTMFSLRPRPWSYPYNGEMFKKVKMVLARQKFEVIYMQQVYLNEVLPSRRYIGNNRVIQAVDLHDILSNVYHPGKTHLTRRSIRFQAWAEWRKVKYYEKQSIRRFDCCMVVSSQDRDVLLQLVPESHPFVIPNGVDIEYFNPNPEFEEENRLLFAGSMSYPPNIDAMLFFCKDIFPLVQAQIPGITLDIVGWQPAPEIQALEKIHGVTVTGLVEDVRPYYQRSTVCVIPIRQGGGTRLKILDAWSSSKAVVSTQFGAQGLDAIHGHNIQIADDPQTFSQAILDLLGDKPKRIILGEAGRMTAVQQYSWSLIAKKLEAAFEDALP